MNYTYDLILRFLLLSNLAIALSVPFRWGSRLVLCQGLFVGFGCYCMALSVNTIGVPVLGALCISICGGAIIGWFMAHITARLDSATFALITYLLGLSSKEIFENWVKITGGRTGIEGLYLGKDWFGLPPKGIAAVLLAFSCFIFIKMYGHFLADQFGRAIRALRDDPVGAALDGIDAYKVERNVLILFGIHSSFVGSLWVFGLPRIIPEYFDFWFLVLQVVLACILAGGLSPQKMLKGAFLVVMIDEATQRLPIPPQVRADVPLIIVGIVYVVASFFGDYFDKNDGFHILKKKETIKDA